MPKYTPETLPALPGQLVPFSGTIEIPSGVDLTKLDWLPVGGQPSAVDEAHTPEEAAARDRKQLRERLALADLVYQQVDGEVKDLFRVFKMGGKSLLHPLTLAWDDLVELLHAAAWRRVELMVNA